MYLILLSIIGNCKTLQPAVNPVFPKGFIYHIVQMPYN